jgi:hypothetical protein
MKELVATYLEEPDLALLKVDIERAEYWDAPSGTMAEIAGLLKVRAASGPSTGGENEKIDLTGATG